MAKPAEITMRAAFTMQALATMGVDPKWDAALSNYLRSEALNFADYEFGVMNVAREVSEFAEIAMVEKHGKGWRGKPDAKAEWKPFFENRAEAEEVYCERYSTPYWASAQDLMATPAPTLAAALFKIAMIEREDLEREEVVDGRCMVFVTEDMARLTGGQA